MIDGEFEVIADDGAGLVPGTVVRVLTVDGKWFVIVPNPTAIPS